MKVLTSYIFSKLVGFAAEFDNGNSGASKSISLAAGMKQKITLNSASILLSVDGLGAPVGNYQIRLIQDGTGGRAVTWSGLSTTRWLGSSTVPAINTASNGETILSIYYDGTNMIQSISKVGAP